MKYIFAPCGNSFIIVLFDKMEYFGMNWHNTIFTCDSFGAPMKCFVLLINIF